MLVAPIDGANVTIQLDAAAIAEDKLAETIKSVASLRRNAMACVFDRAITAVASKSSLPPEAIVRFRPSEPVFILPRADKVSVVYALEFSDPTDWAVARIIAQEFAEAQRTISTAPSINFSDRDPPLELRSMKDIGRQSAAFVGYLTFALHPRHIDTEAKRTNVINLLTQFRPYLDYHIKAAKSYLHARMRNRVDGWMQVRTGTSDFVVD
jgi:actin related protein 2/3 complex subunit 2